MTEPEPHPAHSDATPLERVARPFQVFARFKASGAIVLFAAAVVALVLANSALGDTYRSVLAAKLTVGYGAFELSKPLILWINDALMGVFFFVVGLEIKREVLAGELSTMRGAILPIAAAIGGMVGPALAFFLFNTENPDAKGWGIPMATDIAFALGVLAFLGSRVPLGLKVFLTALAIVDDLGAILVILLFYTEEISLSILSLGGGLLGLSCLLNALGLRSAVVYFGIGALVWLAFLKSGVHATLAAVLMAMTIPARTRIDGEAFVSRQKALLARLRGSGIPRGRRLLSTDQQNILQHMEHSVEHMTAPLQQLEHALMPFVTFFVVPVFALANAGVGLGGEAPASVWHPVSLGIIAGLFFGKQVGIVGASWLAVKLGIASLPTNVTWRQVHAVSVLGGIGFTMSLFVTSLAYRDPTLVSTAKLGVLIASAVATALGFFLLWRATSVPPAPAQPVPDPQTDSTAVSSPEQAPD